MDSAKFCGNCGNTIRRKPDSSTSLVSCNKSHIYSAIFDRCPYCEHTSDSVFEKDQFAPKQSLHMSDWLTKEEENRKVQQEREKAERERRSREFEEEHKREEELFIKSGLDTLYKSISAYVQRAAQMGYDVRAEPVYHSFMINNERDAERYRLMSLNVAHGPPYGQVRTTDHTEGAVCIDISPHFDQGVIHVECKRGRLLSRDEESVISDTELSFTKVIDIGSVTEEDYQSWVEWVAKKGQEVYIRGRDFKSASAKQSKRMWSLLLYLLILIIVTLFLITCQLLKNEEKARNPNHSSTIS